MIYNIKTAVKLTFIFCNIILFFGCSTEIEIKDINNSDLKVIGYVAGYEDFDPSLVDANKLTHINYAFANIVDGEPKFELSTDSIKISKLVALKKINPTLKILYSIGGWVWSNNFY